MAIGRKPAAKSRSIVCICCGESSSIGLNFDALFCGYKVFLRDPLGFSTVAVGAGRGFGLPGFEPYLFSEATSICLITMAWEPPFSNTSPLAVTFLPANSINRGF